VLVGTFAPDLEYFLRLAPDSGFGHTLRGVFLLALPLALAVLWLFHTYVKRPLIRLFPEVLRRRLVRQAGRFRFGGVGRFALIVASVLLGIATHLAWDSFTHQDTWLYYHWALLRQPVHIPVLGVHSLCRGLQHVSTVIGVSALAAWLVHGYRSTAPSDHVPGPALPPGHKIAVMAVITAVALVGATLRAFAAAGVPHSQWDFKLFLGRFVVTAVALIWWQLVAYGMWSSGGADSIAEEER
jgi:hypothetical protein